MKRIVILLGGMWHDFDGFAGAMRVLLEPQDYTVEPTYDLDVLARLDRAPVDLILSYTSLSRHREGYNDTGPDRLTDVQVSGLAAWLRGGGALLAAHSATVLGESNPLLGELIGGTFVSHPPQFSFTVYPLYREHPITAGVKAFTVHDEFYIQRYDAAVDVHMLALDRGVAHPMLWSKHEGQGRVAHVALGHGPDVWNLAPYRQLMSQTVQWLASQSA